MIFEIPLRHVPKAHHLHLSVAEYTGTVYSLENLPM